MLARFLSLGYGGESMGKDKTKSKITFDSCAIAKQGAPTQQGAL